MKNNSILALTVAGGMSIIALAYTAGLQQKASKNVENSQHQERLDLIERRLADLERQGKFHEIDIKELRQDYFLTVGDR